MSDFKDHPPGEGPSISLPLNIVRSGSALLRSGSWSSSRYGRGTSLLGKDAEDESPASWLQHVLAVIAIVVALVLLLRHGRRVQVDLDNPVALGDALQAVDSEWHKAQHLQEELRLERAKLLQAWTSLEGSEEREAEVQVQEGGQQLSQDDIDYYNNLAGKRACPKLDPDSDPACRRVPREEKLKLPSIFVYDLPSKFNRDLSRQYKRCSTDQYGTEVFFHEALLQSPIRTKDPHKADLFFVPI